MARVKGVMGTMGSMRASGVVATAALALALGCGGGSTSSNHGGGGSSGDAAQGGSAVSMSGSGGSAPGGSGGASGSSSGGVSSAGNGGTESFATETEACTAYIDGYCEFLGRCEGLTVSDCERTASTCPDIIFAPGSSRTLESLKGCPEQIANWSCSRWAAGDVPPCITPGTRQVGEPCRFHAQCKSLWCTGTMNMCGVCAESAAPGGACDTSSPTKPIACPLGQLCTGQICQPESRLLMHLELGDTCDDQTRFCDSKYWCNAGKCAALPTVGSACKLDTGCDAISVCNPTTQKCEPAPGIGQSCANAQVIQPCAPGATCDGKVCQPLEGFMCPGGACPDADYNCVTGVCHSRAKNVKGSACSAILRCADGFVCDNAVCKVAAEYHDACDDSVMCPPASTCTAGKCEPNPSQGLFEMVCK